MKLHKGWPELRTQAESHMEKLQLELYRSEGRAFDELTYRMLVGVEMRALRDLTDPHVRDFWVRWARVGSADAHDVKIWEGIRDDPARLLVELRLCDPELDRLHSRQERIKSKMDERKTP